MTFTNIISKTILASAISISFSQLPADFFNRENNLISTSTAGAALTNHETSTHELVTYEPFNHNLSSGSSQTAAPAAPAVLVFSKTNGYRHKSIEAGKEAFKKLGKAI